MLADKQNVVHSNNDILLRNKNIQNTGTYKDIDESQNHCNEWKKPHTKMHVLYDSTHETLEKADWPIVTESTLVACSWSLGASCD